MTVLLQPILVVAGALTALFLARDAPIFGVMQGMIGMALITAVVFALTLASRR